MSNENKLIQKLKRRKAYANRNLAHLKDRMDKRDELMNRNPALYKLFKGLARKFSDSFGLSLIPSPDLKLEQMVLANDLDRFDFGSSDYGIRLRKDIDTAGAKEITQIVAIADTGAFETSLITVPSTAGAVQADYFIFEAPDASKYAVYLDIDAANTPPTGAAYVAAAHKIKASIITGGTAAQNRDIVLTALGTIANMSKASTSTAQITLVAQTFANRTDIARHNADDSGAGSFTVSVTQQGAASVLQNKYFTIRGLAENFYVWMNCNSIGVDPAVAGMTAIPVAITAPATNAQVGLAVKLALDAKADFVATNVSQTVTCTLQEEEAEADAADVNTGFAITTTQQGVTPVNDAILSEVGMQPNDVVELLSGANKGKQYKVVSLIDANTIRLEDDSAFGSAEEDIYVKVRIAGPKRSFN